MSDEPAGRKLNINEDWLAVIVGLALLALVTLIAKAALESRVGKD